MKAKIEKFKKRQARKLYLTLFSTIVSFLALSLSTFAWFSFNRTADTTADKIVISDYYAHEFNYTVDGVPQVNGELNFFGFYPGNVHKRTLTFTLKNTSDGPYQVTLFLNTGNLLNEVPYYDAAKKWNNTPYYYYLGSQIQVSKVQLSIDGTAPTFISGQGSYLLSTSSAGLSKGQVNGVASQLNVMTQVDLLKNVSLANGKTLIGLIEFTFVDNGTDQSMYMEDWPTVGVCKRYLEGAITR